MQPYFKAFICTASLHLALCVVPQFPKLRPPSPLLKDPNCAFSLAYTVVGTGLDGRQGTRLQVVASCLEVTQLNWLIGSVHRNKTGNEKLRTWAQY